MTKSVAVLGCGPTGLMVAHAAKLSGWRATIFSRKVQSKLYGAQYLHQPIPNLHCGNPKMVRYSMIGGTAEMYRRKVYGETWDGTVSPEDFTETHSAWDLRAAYEYLWETYENDIVDCDIQSEWGERPQLYFGKHDLFVSTVPRTIWDNDNSNFERTVVWALGDTEQERVPAYLRPAEDFQVVCSANASTPWYRVSKIFGYCTVEWPYAHAWQRGERDITIPEPGASPVVKPLRYNGNAASDMIHLGRYGKWEKGVLTSDAFYDAMKLFAEAG